MKPRIEIPIAKLREMFRYDPDTGRLFRSSGKPVGGTQGGYLTAWVSSTQRVFVHRIAWAIVHGEWVHELDHINRNKMDNRIANLRPATRVLQSRNRPASKSSKTGILGVCLCAQTGRYKATLAIGGKQIWLGRFGTAQQAAAARKKAEQDLKWERPAS